MICTWPLKTSFILGNQKFWGMVEYRKRVCASNIIFNRLVTEDKTHFFTVFSWYNFQNFTFPTWEISRIRQSVTPSITIVKSQHVQGLAMLQRRKSLNRGRWASSFLPYCREKWRENVVAFHACHWKAMKWGKLWLEFFYSCCCYSSCISREHFPLAPAFQMSTWKIRDNRVNVGGG